MESTEHSEDGQPPDPAPVPLPSPWAFCFCIVNFDLEYGQKIEKVYPSQDFTEEQLTDIAFSSFPDSTTGEGDIVYTFRIPSKQAKVPELFGFVFFRQTKDASISRGYLQKSVVLLSQIGYLHLYKEVIRAVGQSYFQYGDTLLEAAWNNIMGWPEPKHGTTMDLPILGSVFKMHIPPRSGHVVYYPVSYRSPKPHLGPQLPHPDLYTSFKGLNGKLWTLWELMITGEPIMVLSSSPEVSSDATFALTSLVLPLEFGGEHRPFFTIHDSDFKRYSEMKIEESKTGVVLGVTNPYFTKALEHWPHVVAVGEPGEKKVTKVQSGGAERSLKKMSEYKVGLKTDYKAYYQPNKEVVTQSKKAQKAGAASDDTLKLYFRKFTERFLEPLESYLDTLLPSVSTFTILAVPAVKPFREAAFLSQLLDKDLKAKEIHVYRRFIRTTTFVDWYRNKKRVYASTIKKQYCEFLNSYNVQPLIKSKSEIEIVDIYLRVRTFQEKHTEMLSEEMRTRIIGIMDSMLSHLPEDLQMSLHVRRKAVRTTTYDVPKQGDSEGDESYSNGGDELPQPNGSGSADET